ncbi:hypothetical protein [Streptomyces sp. WG-D5]
MKNVFLALLLSTAAMAPLALAVGAGQASDRRTTAKTVPGQWMWSGDQWMWSGDQWMWDEEVSAEARVKV